MAKNDFNMFQFFKGEKRNPFDETENRARFWWEYELVFEDMWIKNESSAWFVFFDEHSLGNEFMKILDGKDYERPGPNKKKPTFDLWLEYLFKYKLYPEYGGKENAYKNDYFGRVGQKSWPVTPDQ